MTISTIDDVILQKAKILRELVSVVSGLRPESKELLWGTTTIILSCMGLIIAPKPLRNIVLPVTDDSDENLLDISTACVLNDPAALRTDRGGARAVFFVNVSPVSHIRGNSGEMDAACARDHADHGN